MQSALKALLHFIYPDICVQCERPLVSSEKYLCVYCEEDLPRTRFRSMQSNPVTDIFYGRVPLLYADAFCYFKKNSAVQRLMHQLKYKHQPGVGLYLGRYMGFQLLTRPWHELPDYLIPVPIHEKKRLVRGYNQAEEIARGIHMVCETPLTYNVLQRQSNTGSQTKLSRWDRWKNVETGFQAQFIDKLPPCAHVLLVDDVITTGATLEACAGVLLNHRPDLRISIMSAAIASE
ncbi:MAG: ComF family protein [Cryomorphaceae bacterium]|nr:ComF family protein [Cryomorphaceae bacterium]